MTVPSKNDSSVYVPNESIGKTSSFYIYQTLALELRQFQWKIYTSKVFFKLEQENFLVVTETSALCYINCESESR